MTKQKTKNMEDFDDHISESDYSVWRISRLHHVQDYDFCYVGPKKGFRPKSSGNKFTPKKKKRKK